MHRYGEAAKLQKGLKEVYTLKDGKSGKLVGIAIWDSEESYLAARPALSNVTAKDDFDAWEAEPPTVHRLGPA